MSEPAEAEETAPPTKVFVEWEGRDHPLGRVVRRRRRLADARNEGRVKPDVPGDIPDPGCLDVGDFLDELFFVAAVVLAIAVFVLYGPALIALLLELLLIVLITAVLIIAAVWRTLLRRPWRVVALRGWDEIWVWHQVGFRTARRLAAQVKAELAAGREPAGIAADRLDAASPLALADMHKGGFDHPWVAIGLRFAVIGLAIFVVVWLAAGWVIEIG